MKKRKKNNILMGLGLIIFAIMFIFSIIPKPNYLEVKSEMIKPEENVVTKIFWFGCPHCYDMNKELNKIKGIKVNYIPASYENSRWEIDAKIFYTMEEVTKNNNFLKKKLINKFFEIYKVKAPSPKVALENLASWTKKDFEKINEIYRSEKINNKIIKLNTEMKKLKVNSVPQIIVEGKYIINQKNMKTKNDYIKEINKLLLK